MTRGAFQALSCALGLLAVGCRAPQGGTRGGAEPQQVAEARSLLSAGDPDGALLALEGRTDPEALTIQGRAWTLKARKAPQGGALEASPATRGPTELGLDEMRALRLLEGAVSAQADLAEAHLAIAELLEPGATRWLAARREMVSPPERRSTTKAPPVVVEPANGPGRVLQQYRRAAQADRASVTIVEAWLRFALVAQRPEEAEVALQELVVRQPRDPDPLIRYGDFLRDVRGDTSGALDRYGEALIWRAGDDSIRSRIVNVFLDLAEEHLSNREYGAAEQRLRDTNRYAPFSDRGIARRHAALAQKLATIRGR